MTDAKIALITTSDSPHTSFVFHLADRHTKEIGFIPRESIRAYLATARVLVLTRNDQAIGYIMPGPARREIRVYQCIVAPDARRIEHGTTLVAELIRRGTAAGAEKIVLHCADDLDANAFWKAIGFAHVGKRCRRKDKGRSQNRWELELPAGKARRELEKREIHDPHLKNLNALLGAWSPSQAAANTILGYRPAEET